MQLFVTYLTLILAGVSLGSFAGASVWRLRARQLKYDKAHGEEYDKEEYKKLSKLTKTDVLHDRSMCLNCRYELKWYDLIPLVSWVTLGGKCRNCRQPIGYFEPLIEIGVAAFFVASYALWPYPLDGAIEAARLAIWLIAGVGLAILFAYDTKWFLLPDKVNFSVIGLGLVSAVIAVVTSSDVITATVDILIAVVILSGIYLMLYLVSKGKWIGFGDIKLGLGLALLLGDWRLAFIALFAANLIGCLIVIPMMLVGKLKRNAHVPFGPLLILGTIVAQFVGFYLVDIYLFNLI